MSTFNGFDEALCNTIAERVHERVQAAAPPTPPAPKTYLGIDGGSWVKLLIGWTLAVVTFLFAWYNTVNAAIEDLQSRPTLLQVEERLKETSTSTQKKIEGVERDVQTIRESQIRQETINTEQAETLKEISQDVKQIRRGM